LSAQQVVQLARHPKRPYTLDYIRTLFPDFEELKGDRHYSHGPAIIGGIATLQGQSVMIIGHQKGRRTQQKLSRNFGMPRPEEYWKSQRLMRMAEKFDMPVLTFIDTPGAYPGVGAEERNQSQAIAQNLFMMSKLRVPIVCTVIGEGGSGGALALGVGDKLYMLQYSTYSVISPEGCASILWRSQDKAGEAAEAMRVTAQQLRELGLNDGVIQEPLGGAHRDTETMAARIKNFLTEALNELQQLSQDDMLTNRYKRLRSYGHSHI
jgi:acetyl-CoA carboxylase carboxyl transferase subunit alpha